MSLAALPDFRITIDEQIAEGRVVVTHWSAKGTQHGPLLGIPPTSRSVTAVAVHIDHLADGRIIDQWEQFDTLGMLRQLGVCASHPPARAERPVRSRRPLPMLLEGQPPGRSGRSA